MRFLEISLSISVDRHLHDSESTFNRVEVPEMGKEPTVPVTQGLALRKGDSAG